MRMTRKRLAVAAAVLLAALGMATLTAGQDQSTKVRTEKAVAVPDMEFMVLRNGKYHKVKVKATGKLVTEPDGTTRTELKHDPNYKEAIDAQLPPEDPALKDVQPTPDEVKAARKAVGVEERPEDQAPPPDVQAKKK